MSSQNKIKVALNPFEGTNLQWINDLELGVSVRNLAKSPFYVAPGFTRIYPNLEIPDGMDIEVQEDGELIVF